MEKSELMNNSTAVIEENALPKEQVLDNIENEEEEVKQVAGQRYLTFELEGEEYGVKIEHVIEIIGLQDITQLPGTPKYVKGLINLRGKIIPLIDAREKFKKPKAEYDDRTCIVVLEVTNIMVGLVVDTISDVVNIPDNEKEDAPNIGKIKANKYIKEIAKINNKVKLLIDCEKLINE